MKQSKKVRKFSKSKKIDWVYAPDIKRRVVYLIKSLDLSHLKSGRIYAYRSTNSKTHAYARIWGLSYLWQKTLKVPPTYIVEVLSEHYDNLTDSEKDKVLLHELTHIPKNFSGALVPHIRRGKRSFHRKVDELIIRYFIGASKNAHMSSYKDVMNKR